MPLPAAVKKHLDKLGLKYTVVPHKTVFTVYDLAQTLKIKLQDIGKILLIKTDKDYHLAVLPAHRRLDLAAVKKATGAKSVSLASEKDMAKKFKVKPGAMTAFGTLHKVPVLLDRGLAKSQQMLISAGSFTDSLRLKLKPYIKSQEPIIAPIATTKRK